MGGEELVKGGGEEVGGQGVQVVLSHHAGTQTRQGGVPHWVRDLVERLVLEQVLELPALHVHCVKVGPCIKEGLDDSWVDRLADGGCVEGSVSILKKT